MESTLFRTDERLTFAEFAKFLRRTDLGRHYPMARFRERVSRLLATANVAFTVRDDERLGAYAWGSPTSPITSR